MFVSAFLQLVDSKMTINRANEEATLARNGFSRGESHVLEKDSKLLLICCALASEEMDGFHNWLWLFNLTPVEPSSTNVFFLFNSKRLCICLKKGTWVGENSIYIPLAIIGIVQPSLCFCFLFIFYHDLSICPTTHIK